MSKSKCSLLRTSCIALILTMTLLSGCASTALQSMVATFNAETGADVDPAPEIPNETLKKKKIITINPPN